MYQTKHSNLVSTNLGLKHGFVKFGIDMGIGFGTFPIFVWFRIWEGGGLRAVDQWATLWNFGPFGPPWATFGHLDQFGLLRSTFGHSGPLWATLGNLGHFGPFEPPWAI